MQVSFRLMNKQKPIRFFKLINFAFLKQKTINKITDDETD
jgi:hypothetical protein